MNNNSEQIGRYLQKEMNAEERAAFEKQLTDDKDLQQELSIQKQIVKAVETAGLKNTFGKAIRRRIINQRLIQFGVAAVIVVTAAFVFYAIKTNKLFHGKRTSIESAETFVINNAADTIIETDEGVVFAIPAHAFNSKSDKVQLEIKTAISPYNIMRQGLSTTSNGSLLQTAGMFYINGYENEKPLSLVKNIDVSIPANEINPAMQLFDGVQDSSGRINWVDPKPIENKLRTYDIATLDFYPPNYIPALKALQKDYTNKKYTDSLYYSFSGYGHDNPVIESAKKVDTTVIREQSEIKQSPKGPSADLDEWQTDKAPEQDTLMDRYYREIPYEIDPSRIRAIWSRKFNNTLLATKEFEERLRYMHGLCTSEGLALYLKWLDKPMYEIDQYLADRTSGSIKEKFLEFAARKDGRVMLKQGIHEKLSTYFEKKYRAYREATEKTGAKYEAELNRLNKVADQKKREQGLRDFIREDKNFNEEFCINLSEAYRQIGVNRTCNDTIPPPPTNYYNVTIDTVGWKNLDVYVFDATTTRQSMSYTDPVSGKTASLTYKDVNITIEDQTQYDKVLVYLIPDTLSSFQRIEEEGNVFKESLNSLFKYDAIAIAYKGTQAFFYRKVDLQPGNYVFKLSSVTEQETKDQLKKYSRQRVKDINSEFEYLLFEQQEAIREMQLRQDQDFRLKVATAIFSCFGEGYNWPAKSATINGPK
jgi:hypothetical protein